MGNTIDLKTTLKLCIESYPTEEAVNRIYNYVQDATDLKLKEFELLNSLTPKEETFTITKEQIKSLHFNGSLTNQEDLECMFPKAFEEEKKELVVGKWYKSKNIKTAPYGLFFLTNNKLIAGRLNSDCGYGFDYLGNWKESNYDLSGTKPGSLVESTNQEVEEALKNEAVRRGFKEGVYFIDQTGQEQVCNGQMSLNEKYKGYSVDGLCFGKSNGLIFRNGVWATIIPTITKAEAEKELGKKIV